MTLCPFNREGPTPEGEYTFTCPACGITRNARGKNLKRMCPKLPSEKPPGRGLGDTVASALELVGITPDRVTKWLGRPCGCKERKERLNQLGRWAKRIITGKTDKASDYLDEILESKK